jgi:EcoRII C terminal/Restriction endonuclease EcoRII, N-terminal
MQTYAAEKAIGDVLKYERALLKIISPNNVGLTGSHECGYYLPKAVWKLLTPHAPVKGENREHLVDIVWPDSRVTESRVMWYGSGTRSEYRLTRFGRDFPWLTEDNVGDLLILVPTGPASFVAHVLDLEEDIEHVLAILCLELSKSWAIYPTDDSDGLLTQDECVDKRFREFAQDLDTFPNTAVFSGEVIATLKDCINDFSAKSPDNKLLQLVETEYRLFRLVERRLCTDQVSRLFKSVDDFLKTAASIMNRRKSRAGRSLENHVEYVLQEADIPFEVQPDIDGRPDIIIPSKAAYDDSKYPTDRLFTVGIKTTCKDRWRQVLNESRRVSTKHLLTIQNGVSSAQLDEMRKAGIQLVVPDSLHKLYPPKDVPHLSSVKSFIASVRERMS